MNWNRIRVRIRRTWKPFVICLIIAIGLKVGFKISGDGIKDGYRVEPELEKYLEDFINLADARDIDLSYVYSDRITIVWEHAINRNSTNVATSFGRNKDAIIIVVNKKRFMARTEEGRRYVMFHELGHDILNFEHLTDGKRGMMEPTAYTGFFKNYDRFNQDRQLNYLYTSLWKMFDRYLGDGIQDDDCNLNIEDLRSLNGRMLTKPFQGIPVGVGENDAYVKRAWAAKLSYYIFLSKNARKYKVNIFSMGLISDVEKLITVKEARYWDKLEYASPGVLIIKRDLWCYIDSRIEQQIRINKERYNL